MNIFEQIICDTLGILEGVSSAKKKYVATGELSKRHFQEYVDADPSKSKKYVEWMSKIGVEEAWANEVIIKVVRDFDRLASKGYLKNKDIYRYKTLEEVEEVLKDSKNKERLKQISKERASDIDRIKETDTYLILFPRTYEAVKKYGAHTKWCITSSAKDWEEVVRDGDKYYFVIDKVKNRKYAVDSRRWVYDDLDSSLEGEEKKAFFDMLGFSSESAEAKSIFAPFTKKEQAEVLAHLIK